MTDGGLNGLADWVLECELLSAIPLPESALSSIPDSSLNEVVDTMNRVIKATCALRNVYAEEQLRRVDAE